MSQATDTTSTSVERALSILEAVGQRQGGMTNSEISRRLEIPKSSASYVLRVLERRGYLQRDDESGKYRLGLAVLALARNVGAGEDVRMAAQPILRQLADKCRLTTHLGMLDSGEAVYVHKEEVPGLIRMNTWPGRRTDAHSTSIGKAIIAWLPVEEVDEIVRRRGLTKRTPKTITSAARLRRELEATRERGYAIDEEENNLGVRCVAAPIFDETGRVVASINITGTTGQIAPEQVAKLGEIVRDAARKISQKIGG